MRVTGSSVTFHGNVDRVDLHVFLAGAEWGMTFRVLGMNRKLGFPERKPSRGWFFSRGFVNSLPIEPIASHLGTGFRLQPQKEKTPKEGTPTKVPFVHSLWFSYCFPKRDPLVVHCLGASKLRGGARRCRSRSSGRRLRAERKTRSLRHRADRKQDG